MGRGSQCRWNNGSGGGERGGQGLGCFKEWNESKRPVLTRRRRCTGRRGRWSSGDPEVVIGDGRGAEQERVSGAGVGR
jgi:hypothetical protein